MKKLNANSMLSACKQQCPFTYSCSCSYSIKAYNNKKNIYYSNIDIRGKFEIQPN